MIPNCEAIIRRLAAEHPQEWRDAHNPSGGGPHTEAFARRVAWVLHSTVDARFGLNGKRGDPNDISDDVVNWIGEGPGHDPATGRPVTVIDYISGAGGANPSVYWGPINLPGPGAWVQPTPPADAPHPPPTRFDVWTPAHEAIRVRMAGRPVKELAEQLAYQFPSEQWGGKRTAGGQASPDTIARFVTGQLWAIKVTPSVTIYGLLDHTHVHLPVSPVNHLGAVVDPPPPPPPPVDDPPSGGGETPGADTTLSALLEAAQAQFAAIERLTTVVSAQGTEIEALKRRLAAGFDIVIPGSRFVPTLRGTVTPKEG